MVLHHDALLLLLKLFYYILLSISIQVYWKGEGLGVLPQENFSDIGTKLGNSRHF